MRDMRPHHANQRRDLARMVHADLEHAVSRVGRQPRQRQRHAPVIVVTRRPRRASARAPTARARSHLLGAGLADGAGDGDDAGLRPRAGGRAEPLHARAACRRRRRADRPPARRRAPRDDRGDGAGLRRPRATWSWPSCVSPLMATNRSPGCSVRVSMETPVAPSVERAVARPSARVSSGRSTAATAHA